MTPNEIFSIEEIIGNTGYPFVKIGNNSYRFFFEIEGKIKNPLITFAKKEKKIILFIKRKTEEADFQDATAKKSFYDLNFEYEKPFGIYFPSTEIEKKLSEVLFL